METLEDLQIEEKIQNTLESKSPFVDIVFGPDGRSQKFVPLSDDNKNMYIASYPMSEDMKFHIKVATKGVENFKAKGIKDIGGMEWGGGYLKKEGDQITYGGKSSQLKGEWDQSKVEETLHKAFPDMKLVFDSYLK